MKAKKVFASDSQFRHLTVIRPKKSCVFQVALPDHALFFTPDPNSLKDFSVIPQDFPVRT